MKASELRQKTSAELNELLVSFAKEQFNLRMQKGTQELFKPSQLKQVRRDIARIHTIAKELARA